MNGIKLRPHFFAKSRISRMDCFSRTLSTPTGDVFLHYLVYPNQSVFVWVSLANELEFDDFHVAVPDQFSSLPAVTSRMGGDASVGRNVALRLSKKLACPVIVSWSLPDELPIDASGIETEIFSDIRQRRSLSPAVIGA